MNQFEDEIRSYMDAAFPILYIYTSEVERAKRAIFRATAEVPKIRLPVWDGTDRVCDLRSGEVEYEEMKDGSLREILDDCMSLDDWDWDDSVNCVQMRQAVILENIDSFKDDPAVISRLKKFAALIHNGNIDATIFILSPTQWIAPELEKYITVLEMKNPEEEEIRSIIRQICTQTEMPQLSEQLMQKYVAALKGLSELEIEQTLQHAYSKTGELNKDHISLIHKQKRQIIQKAGILEMIPLEEDLSDIGGMKNLKDWLMRKEKTMSRWAEAKSFGVAMPKGVLIAGMPGCGKSLSAKAAAKLFNVPLLRLDMGRLLGKYQGESEGNMRKAIQLAEAISPCVLWIDELEKAFAGTGGDDSGGGVATRLLGSFLTWLQEKKSAAFVVATANDIERLPPELLRKGRLDEIFYAGLPNRGERCQIFKIHIQKRRPEDLKETGSDGKPLIDLNRLADESKGFSGADIEGVVRESVEIAFQEGAKCLKTDDILSALKHTSSLSEIRKVQLTKLEHAYIAKGFTNASIKGDE